MEGRDWAVGAAAATVAVKKESETDMKLKIKDLFIKNYPTSSSAVTGGGGGDLVGGDAELVQHFTGVREAALYARARLSASQNTLWVSECAADSGNKGTGQ